MIAFDFRVLYARADDRGQARRAIVTYAKHPCKFGTEEMPAAPGLVTKVQRVVTKEYQNGLWIELGFVTIRLEWKSKA